MNKDTKTAKRVSELLEALLRNLPKLDGADTEPELTPIPVKNQSFYYPFLINKRGQL